MPVCQFQHFRTAIGLSFADFTHYSTLFRGMQVFFCFFHGDLMAKGGLEASLLG